MYPEAGGVRRNPSNAYRSGVVPAFFLVRSASRSAGHDDRLPQRAGFPADGGEAFQGRQAFGFGHDQVLADWMAFHTRIGVAGMSKLSTPSGASASINALMTAAGEPTDPASPIPLTPSGFVVAGISSNATQTSGMSSARGIA